MFTIEINRIREIPFNIALLFKRLYRGLTHQDILDRIPNEEAVAIDDFVDSRKAAPRSRHLRKVVEIDLSKSPEGPGNDKPIDPQVLLHEIRLLSTYDRSNRMLKKDRYEN